MYSPNTIRLPSLALALLLNWSANANAQTLIQPLPNSVNQPGAYGSSQPTYLPPIGSQSTMVTQATAQQSPYTLPTQVMQQTAQQAQRSVGQAVQSGINSDPYLQYANQFPGPGNQFSGAAPYAAAPHPSIAPVQYDDSGVVGSGAREGPLPLPRPSPDVSGNDVDLSSLTPLPAEAFVADPEYTWYQYPWAWIPRDGWDSSVEFGLNGTKGNANSLSYAAGADLARKGDIYNLGINLDYRKTSSGGLDTQDNARANFDLDRAIAESAMSAFVKSGLEYDRFKAFDARVNVNSGLSYFWANTDRSTLVTRIGAGASQEIGSVNEDWKPEMLFGLDLKQQVNSRNKVFVKVDYFPAFEDFTDYRVVTDAGWEILLDDAENFSLKLSATNRYDSTPLGLKPQDVDYAATLLYKF